MPKKGEIPKLVGPGPERIREGIQVLHKKPDGTYETQLEARERVATRQERVAKLREEGKTWKEIAEIEGITTECARADAKRMRRRALELGPAKQLFVANPILYDIKYAYENMRIAEEKLLPPPKRASALTMWAWARKNEDKFIPAAMKALEELKEAPEEDLAKRLAPDSAEALCKELLNEIELKRRKSEIKEDKKKEKADDD